MAAGAKVPILRSSYDPINGLMLLQSIFTDYYKQLIVKKICKTRLNFSAYYLPGVGSTSS